MVKTIGLFHIGIPVDDLDRAERFYTEVLGMTLQARIDHETGLQARLQCGRSTVVLVQRPRPLGRSRREEDGILHNAFEIAPGDFERTIHHLKDRGLLDGEPVSWMAGAKAAYFYDSEGNYGELHATMSS